jgi:hypothetical protein
METALLMISIYLAAGRLPTFRPIKDQSGYKFRFF